LTEKSLHIHFEHWQHFHSFSVLDSWIDRTNTGKNGPVGFEEKKNSVTKTTYSLHNNNFVKWTYRTNRNTGKTYSVPPTDEEKTKPGYVFVPTQYIRGLITTMTDCVVN
jgi:hypothetical protein